MMEPAGRVCDCTAAWGSNGANGVCHTCAAPDSASALREATAIVMIRADGHSRRSFSTRDGIPTTNLPDRTKQHQKLNVSTLKTLWRAHTERLATLAGTDMLKVSKLGAALMVWLKAVVLPN